MFESEAELAEYGEVGAGEGPAWHPGTGLYFSGGGRVTLRTLEGELQEVELPGGGAGFEGFSDIFSTIFGEFMDPRRSLAPGDVVECEIGGIGTLRNPVIAEG